MGERITYTDLDTLPHGRFFGAEIDPLVLNFLPQPRKTFTNIDELAEDIAEHGVLYPPLVGIWYGEHKSDFIDYLNPFRGTNSKIEDLIPIEEGKDAYCIVIDGERRGRAVKYLANQGRFFDGGTSNLRVQMAINYSPAEAVDRQYSANLHENVPVYEEAEDLNNLFKLRKKMDPKYSLAQFSREVGRSAQTLREATKFCTLPESIQEMVKKRRLPYGMALEITRLIPVLLEEIKPKAKEEEGEVGKKLEEELQRWALRGVISGIKVPEFKVRIDSYLKERSNGQQSMMAVFDEVQRECIEKQHQKKVVGERILGGVHTAKQYIQTVLNMVQEGILESDVLPFTPEQQDYSLGSPLRTYQALVGLEEILLPHIKNKLSSERRKRVEVTLRETKFVISELLDEKTLDTELQKVPSLAV